MRTRYSPSVNTEQWISIFAVNKMMDQSLEKSQQNPNVLSASYLVLPQTTTSNAAAASLTSGHLQQSSSHQYAVWFCCSHGGRVVLLQSTVHHNPKVIQSVWFIPVRIPPSLRWQSRASRPAVRSFCKAASRVCWSRCDFVEAKYPFLLSRCRNAAVRCSLELNQNYTRMHGRDIWRG